MRDPEKYTEPLMQWFLAKCQPRKEELAQSHLKRQGFGTFLPLMVPPPRNRGQAKSSRPQFEPVFRGYIFVQIDTGRDRWRSINGTIGVAYLVQFGGSPGIVPTCLVESLMARTDAQGLLGFEDVDTLKVGDDVQILGGTFDGLVGVLQRTHPGGRVEILMDIMSRRVPVIVPRQNLVLAETDADS